MRRKPKTYIQEVKTKGRSYFYLRPPQGSSARRQLLGHSFAEAENTVREMHLADVIEADARIELEAYIAGIVYAARQRAKVRGIQCSITTKSIIDMMQQQDFECAVSGIKLSMKRIQGRGAFCRPYAPSIDRIDPNGGYVQENVRVTSRIANFSMNQWGEGPLVKMLAAFRGHPKRSIT